MLGRAPHSVVRFNNGTHGRSQMKIARSLFAWSFLVLPLVAVPALADDGHQFPTNATFSTLITTPLVIEGMTNDNRGNLFVPGRSPGAGVNCPVWRIDIDNPALVEVGFIPPPSPTGQCSPSGLAFDRTGRLYVAEGDKIYRFFPDAAGKPLATVFATGVPGANGVAFDG